MKKVAAWTKIIYLIKNDDQLNLHKTPTDSFLPGQHSDPAYHASIQQCIPPSASAIPHIQNKGNCLPDTQQNRLDEQ